MNSQFTLADLVSGNANFIKRLENQRRDELKGIKKNKNVSDRFRNVLNTFYMSQPRPRLRAYRVLVTADLRFEYKNKDKTRSGRVRWETYQNIDVLEAVNEADLEHVFRRTYTVKKLSKDDSEKFVDAENIEYELMDEERLARQPEIQLMTSGRTIIAKEWLQYAKNVSPDAFVETNNECCYYQLSKFLNNPPSNKEQKSFKYGSDKFKTDSSSFLAKLPITHKIILISILSQVYRQRWLLNCVKR
jgi:hypothetical protein